VQRFLLGLVLSAGCTQVALAQTEYLHPMLTVLPQVPSSSDTIQFQILDNTGVHATVDSSSISIQGTTIEIDAQITLSVVNAMLFYSINKQLSALPEGRYTVRYLAQVRQPPPTPDYTAPTVVGRWDLVVAGQSNITPHIEPFPPITGTSMSLRTLIPSPVNPPCGWTFTSRNASVSGNEVLVTYSLAPPTGPVVCFPEPPPSVLNVSIGALAVGDYTATVRGDYAGAPNPPIVFSFTVLPAPVPAIEYYLAREDHYFMTADTNEINLLDNGRFPGWVRTGQSIGVFPPGAVPSGNPTPVCRFYGLPQAGLDSHFYSASPAECERVIDRFPSAWVLESSNVFMAYLPNPADGSCPANTLPVYRMYNNRPDVDHRYTTSLTIRAQITNAGWIAEGYGPNTVAMCAP
jgi:hypothetical protein